MAVSTHLVRVVDGRLVPVPGVWEFDPGHTEVGFVGTHLKVSRVRGRFRSFRGRLIVGEVPEQSAAELTIDAASLESGFKDRDDHLKSADWFDVERFPTISFRTTDIAHVSGNHWTATGTLAIKDVARPVHVDVHFTGAAADPWGNSKIGATIRAEVDRADWGLTWNMPLSAGGLLVGRTVELMVEVEAVNAGDRIAAGLVP